MAGSGGRAMLVSAGYFCPVPQAGKWNFKLAADFGETDVGDAVFSRQFTKGKLPDLFVQFLPVPRRVLTMHPGTLLKGSSAASVIGLT